MKHRFFLFFFTLFLILTDPLALPTERIISVKEEHVPEGRGADPEIICFFK